MKFRPCIDIHNGKVKQIVGGSLQDQGDRAKENFVSEKDAGYYADFYREAGLGGGHIIMLNPRSSPYYEATKAQALLALGRQPGRWQIGGGINGENAAQFLDAGASHVIVTSYVFRDGQIYYENLEKLLREVGREHLVLDLSCRAAGRKASVSDKGPAGKELPDPDCEVEKNKASGPDDRSAGEELPDPDCEAEKNKASGPDGESAGKELPDPDCEAGKKSYYIVTDRWQKFTDVRLCPEVLDELSAYCDEFLIHAADVEGKAQGIEQELVRMLGNWQGIPVTYAGGVGTYEDIRLLGRLGQGRVDVTVGSALDLFGGKLSFEEVVRCCS